MSSPASSCVALDDARNHLQTQATFSEGVKNLLGTVVTQLLTIRRLVEKGYILLTTVIALPGERRRILVESIDFLWVHRRQIPLMYFYHWPRIGIEYIHRRPSRTALLQL
jgi:hypothetical protein